MAKKYYLKKSYIIQGINLYVIRFIMYLLKPTFITKKGTILIKTTDGIGDLLIRSELCKKIIEKYGKKNVFFLLNENYLEIGELLEYNCIGMKKNNCFFYRLKKIYTLNKMGFEKFINLEFDLETIVGNLMVPERIGMEEEFQARKRNNKYLTKRIKRKTENYILDSLVYLGSEILEYEIQKNDIIPNLKNKFEDGSNGITVCVGTSSCDKVTSPYIMLKYIEEIRKRYPNEKIYLLGNSNIQRKYAEILEENLPKIEFINLVDKITIKQAFETIAKSKLFVGFDSGMYNFAYTIQKPTIALFESQDKHFAHKVPWIKIIFPINEEGNRYEIEDLIYTNKKMNNIPVEKIIDTLWSDS